jgi:acetyltransferase (GNAT) family protein
VYREVIFVALDVTREVPDVERKVPVTMRLLAPHDLEAYARFRAQPAGHPQALRRLEKGDACIAAWLDDEIVSAGWYSFGIARVDDIDRELVLAPGEIYGYDLYTSEGLRGLGVASQRGHWAAHHFRTCGYERVVAGLAPQNLPVQGPTRMLGYDTLGRAGFVRLGPLRRDFIRLEGGTRRWGRRVVPLETARDFGSPPER